jgi:hypothetical protein
LLGVALDVRSDVLSDSPVRRRFFTRPADELRDVYLKLLGQPRYLQQFDPLILQQALAFTRLFTEKDSHSQRRWAAVEVRDGAARAMPRETGDRLGVFSSDKLAGLCLGVRHEFIGRLANLLSRFEPAQTHLFDTVNHHVFHDGYTCVAFEKALSRTPPLPGGLKPRPLQSKTIVDRKTLLEEMKQVESVSSYDLSRDFSITLRIEGWLRGQLWLRTRDADPRSRAVGGTHCRRDRGDDTSRCPPIFLRSVSLQTLQEVIGHFETPNIVLEELQAGILRLPFDGPDFQATAWIASVAAAPNKKRAQGGEGKPQR